LLAMKDGKSLVTSGENRYHAIFGGGPAYFVSASSFGPALAALGATLSIASPTKTRTVSAADFFVAPKDDKTREIALAPNEIVTEISVPTGTTNATYEVRHKEGLDWPLVTASVSLKMSGKSVTSASVVLGHVAPTPWNAAAAAKSLAGKTIDEQVAEAAGAAATEGASPLSQNDYKVQLVKVAVKRALLLAAGVA
jgi:xanthine dehydrogenase YagS FAD-binding subunit